MTTKKPVFDIFIGRSGDAWRLYLAPTSWAPPMLSMRMDEHREIFPVAAPDPSELDAFMFAADAPYEKRVTADSGLEIRAAGRSAIVLHEWLAELVGAPP